MVEVGAGEFERGGSRDDAESVDRRDHERVGAHLRARFAAARRGGRQSLEAVI